MNFSYKTPWFIKAYNAVYKHDTKAYLDVDRLISMARKRTGLKDLGNDFNDETIQVLVDSAIQEAELSPFGEFVFREKLLGQLSNKLRAEYWFKKHPEILEQELLPVYLITGMQRTGTTKMQRLLSCQEGAFGISTWKALNPAPIGELNEERKRKKLANISARSVKMMAPNFHEIHPIIVNDVEEDILLLDVNFMSTTFEAILNVPAYSKWLENNYNDETYAFERKLLLLMQYGSDQKYWVLKSPHHLEFLDSFDRVLNPKKIIWTHRSLDAVVPSLLSMIYYSRGLFRKEIDLDQVVDHWIPKMVRMTTNGISSAKQLKQKITHLDFNHWIDKEKETVSNILNIDQSSVKVLASSYKSKHSYDLADFGLNLRDLKNQFENYHQFYTNLNKHGA